MRTIVSVILLFLLSNAAMAANYNYMLPEELKQRIKANDDILIIDIQVEEDFKQHHIPGSLATHA